MDEVIGMGLFGMSYLIIALAFLWFGVINSPLGVLAFTLFSLSWALLVSIIIIRYSNLKRRRQEMK